MQIFTAPFRIFFFLTALIATLVPMYFVGIVVNDYHFTESFFNGLTWHGHEMVFGFPIALITGFVLTASAHWTGKTTSTKKSLIFLTLLWLMARTIAFYQPNSILIFIFLPLPTLALLIQMLFILKGNRNFIPLNGVLLSFLASQYLNLYGNFTESSNLVEISYIIATYTIFTLLFIFSGRLIPFFTNSRFQEKLVTLKSKEEAFSWACLSFYFLSYVFSYSDIQLFFAATCLVLFVRRSFLLYSKVTLKEPMVLILSLAHSWFPIYFAVRIFNLLSPDFNLGRSGLHSFFTGALAMFALALMTRASLGHTGNKLKADKLITGAFILVYLGALMRVFIPLLGQRLFDYTLHISMGTWTLGFIFFIIKFTPIYCRPRADQK